MCCVVVVVFVCVWGGGGGARSATFGLGLVEIKFVEFVNVIIR